MPYIKQDDRNSIRRYPQDHPDNAGELNFMITTLVDAYIEKELNYAKINEVIGVLECAKLELYRRVAVPYEDVKKESNGDCYSSIHAWENSLPPEK